MYDWCHSGLEGYCKAASGLLGDESSDDVVLKLCKDLLPDRTPKTLTRAWTFSNVRRGRDCRQSLFEKCWLAGRHGKDYVDEARLFVKGLLPKEKLGPCAHDQDYAMLLRTTRSQAECDEVALRRCEADAIDACVNRIIELSRDDERLDVANDAIITSLVMLDHFSELFFDQVVPAIERGFLSERYSSVEARQFVMTLGGLMDRAHRCVTSEDSSFDSYRLFLRVIVAGLIYGPNHPIAMDREWDVTECYEPYFGVQAVQGTTIRLTQVYGDYEKYTGYSELFRPAQVVFFGMCPDVGEYLERCDTLFHEEAETMHMLRSLEAKVFPMTLHDAVSNVHAMMVCEGDVWRLYDLGSSNGTSIASEGRVESVDHLIKIKPGDRIRLGAPVGAHDANVYWSAATILVSLNVDRTEELV